MPSRLIVLSVCLLLVLLPSHVAVAATGSPTDSPSSAALQQLLDDYVAHDPLVPGVIVNVESPRQRLSFTGASGRFRHGSARPLSHGDMFRVSSVTKTFTAATALRLVEEGRLRLDDTLDDHLPRDLVDRVHVHRNRSYGHEVTIRQLLNHTSGIYDYATDPAWMAQVIAQPSKTWFPRELIEVAIQNGEPHFPPGNGFAYSDTGYTLVGLVIEAVTRTPLHRAYRELLPLERLDVAASYVEFYEPPRVNSGERAHQYFGLHDMTTYNPTFDAFGGGGHVATAEDLTRFVRGLFEGKVFRKKSTLTSMLEVTSHEEYGLGIYKQEIHGHDAWLHRGFFGAFMYYFPTTQLSIAGSDNQMLSDSHQLISDIVDLLDDGHRPHPRRGPAVPDQSRQPTSSSGPTGPGPHLVGNPARFKMLLDLPGTPGDPRGRPPSKN